MDERESPPPVATHPSGFPITGQCDPRRGHHPHPGESHHLTTKAE